MINVGASWFSAGLYCSRVNASARPANAPKKARQTADTEQHLSTQAPLLPSLTHSVQNVACCNQADHCQDGEPNGCQDNTSLSKRPRQAQETDTCQHSRHSRHSSSEAVVVPRPMHTLPIPMIKLMLKDTAIGVLMSPVSSGGVSWYFFNCVHSRQTPNTKRQCNCATRRSMLAGCHTLRGLGVFNRRSLSDSRRPWKQGEFTLLEDTQALDSATTPYISKPGAGGAWVLECSLEPSCKPRFATATESTTASNGYCHIRNWC